MKKTILSLAMLAGLTSAAQAQTGLKLGLKGGVNLSSFSGADSSPFGYKYGFSAGGVLNYGFSDMIAVQGELLYSQKGTNSDLSFSNSGGGSATYNMKQTLQYVDIPVLFKVSTGEGGKGLFFELGPQASIVVAQRTFSDNNTLTTAAGLNNNIVPVNNPGPTTSDADTKSVPFGNTTDGMNKVVLAYAAGLGYQLTSGLGLGLRYTGDISQVYKDTKLADGTSPVNVHNSVFQFQVHYLFGGN